MGILGTVTERTDYLPVSAEWITPEGAAANKAILYFHGGGLQTEHAISCRSAVVDFIDTYGYRALLLHCPPASGISVSAAVNESAGIYLRLLERGYRPEDIVFAGDSAGGGIAFCTLIKLKNDGIPMPAACAAFSPDLELVSSHLTDPTGLLWDLTGLPPIMIHVGYDEIQRNIVTLFGAAADSCGVDVRVKVWKSMSRGCPLLAPGSEDSVEAVNQTAAFINHHMRKQDGIPAALFYATMLLHF